MGETERQKEEPVIISDGVATMGYDVVRVERKEDTPLKESSKTEGKGYLEDEIVGEIKYEQSVIENEEKLAATTTVISEKGTVVEDNGISENGDAIGQKIKKSRRKKKREIVTESDIVEEITEELEQCADSTNISSNIALELELEVPDTTEPKVGVPEPALLDDVSEVLASEDLVVKKKKKKSKKRSGDIENKRKKKSVDISSEIGEEETTTSVRDEQMEKKPRKKVSNRIVNDDQGDTEKFPRRKKSSKIESSQECATVNQVATESIDARVEVNKGKEGAEQKKEETEQRKEETEEKVIPQRKKSLRNIENPKE